jgi:hypothetical protein
VPLSRIQTEILKLLASHRNPESYVAGSTPLNREAPRYSGDIDVFHDREELVAQAAEADAAVLQEHGYTLQWQRRQPTICTVLVQRPGEETKLEWVVDSDFRFFPTRRDEMFGYVLHPVDLAMNKTMAAAGRREVRGLVDLVTIPRRHRFASQKPDFFMIFILHLRLLIRIPVYILTQKNLLVL